MLDIEIIKWGCQFADGFESIELDKESFLYPKNNNPAVIWHEHTELIRRANQFNEYNMIQYFSLESRYSLFLQRVIEGVNYSELTYCITIDQSGLRIWKKNLMVYLRLYQKEMNGQKHLISQ